MGLFNSLFGSKKPEESSGGNPDVNDLLNALDNYIHDYEKTNGRKPNSIMLDHNIHMMFAHAGVYRTQRFGNIDIIPTANIEGGVIWRAVTETMLKNETKLKDLIEKIRNIDVAAADYLASLPPEIGAITLEDKADRLDFLMDFGDTPQGVDYWNKINNKLLSD